MGFHESGNGESFEVQFVAIGVHASSDLSQTHAIAYEENDIFRNTISLHFQLPWSILERTQRESEEQEN